MMNSNTKMKSLLLSVKVHHRQLLEIKIVEQNIKDLLVLSFLHKPLTHTDLQQILELKSSKASKDEVSTAVDVLHEVRLKLPKSDPRHKKSVKKIRKKQEATMRYSRCGSSHKHSLI